MQSQTRKRVLVCSIPCWNSKTGSDTFSSLLKGYGADNVANLYIRTGVPDSPACNNYFCMSEAAVIKSILKRKIKTGKCVTASASATEEHGIKIVEVQYKKNTTKRNYLLLMLREILWLFGQWKSPELDCFLDEFKPDTVFFAMEGYIHFNRINRYILKRTQARGVGYFWDDNFTYKQSDSLGYKLYRFFQRRDLKKTAKLCSTFFAITPKTKQEADAFFGIDCQLLTKPIDFEDAHFEPCVISQPLQILYTGKLIIGRFDTLKLLGDALDQVNLDSVRIEANVYTTTVLSDEQLQDLSPYIHMRGAIPQTEITNVQKNADILLFVEALSGENSRIARLSFSTKITDYFKSGKCILAIGAPDIAPMEYLQAEDAAITASSFEEIVAVLHRLIKDPSLVNAYAEKAYNCGRRNHDQKDIQQALFNVLNDNT